MHTCIPITKPTCPPNNVVTDALDTRARANTHTQHTGLPGLQEALKPALQRAMVPHFRRDNKSLEHALQHQRLSAYFKDIETRALKRAVHLLRHLMHGSDIETHALKEAVDLKRQLIQTHALRGHTDTYS
jgi:hypothetical protein